MERGLRVITLRGPIEKSPILLSQYWKIIGWHHNYSYFGGSNNIFVDCTWTQPRISSETKSAYLRKFKIIYY